MLLEPRACASYVARMATIHVADARSRAFAKQLVPVFANKNIIDRRAIKLAVRASTGAEDELLLVVGEPSFTTQGNKHFGVVSLDVTRSGVARRLRVKTQYWCRKQPAMKERQELLAHSATRMLLPYFTKPAPTPAKKSFAKKQIHVNGFHVQDEPKFRSRVVSRLTALGFRTKVTLGLSDTDPDPHCWGYLEVPSLNSWRWKDGKIALSASRATASGHDAKTTIRATVAPTLPEAQAAALLADKLVAWYGKLAAVAQS